MRQQTFIPHQSFQRSCKSCDTCGIDASVVKYCDSCASSVCNTCMAESEVCCLVCLETFPVAASSDVLDGSKVHWPVPFEWRKLDRPTAGTVGHSAGDTVATEHSAVSEHERAQNIQLRSSMKDGAAPSPLANQLQSHFTANQDTPRQMQQVAANTSSQSSTRTLLPLYESTSQLSSVNAHSEVDVSGKATTTMMFCNIPCRASHEEVTQVIDSAGFADMYDFIYLPRLSCFKSSNIGYAFVDFKSPQDASEFARVMEGFQFPWRKSAKKCTVKRADKQHFNRQSRKGNAC